MENRAAQTSPRLRTGFRSGDTKGTSGNRFSAAAISRAAVAFLQDRRKVMIAGAVLGAVIVLLGVMLVARKPAPLPVAATSAAGAPAQTDSSAKEASAEKTEAPAAPQGQAKVAGAKSTKSGAAQAGVPPGTVHLSVAPWGEIYVNGKRHGVSPPIKSLKLAPGKYKIEIRNTTFAPRTEVVEVKSRKDVVIKQVFK
jgi:hypothetical protein